MRYLAAVSAVPLALLMLTAPVSSFASSSGNLAGSYLGLDGTQWNLDDGDIDAEAKTVRVRAGYNFGKYLAIESHLTVGGSDTLNIPAGAFDSAAYKLKTELDYLYGAYLKGKLPIYADTRLYGLVGVTHIAATQSLALQDGYGVLAEVSASDTNPAVGLGIELDFTPHVSFVADVMRHTIGASDYDLDTYQAGITYRF